MGWAAKGPDLARGIPGAQPRASWSSPRAPGGSGGLDTSFFPTFVVGGPGRREGAEGEPAVAHSRVYFWVGEMRRFLLLLGPRKAPPPGRGWAPGSGAEAIASRGRARPAKIGPRALWTRGEHSPPRGSELLRGTELDDPQPNRSEMPPSSLRFQSLTKKAPAPGHSLFRRVQAPKAGGRARASPETLQPELQLDRSTPLVPGDFGVRRGNQNTSPQSARAGLFAIGSPAHSTGPRLASV